MNKLPELAVLSQSQLAIYAECMQHPEEATYDQPFLLPVHAMPGGDGRGR